MKSIAVVTAAALLIAGQAHALSCLPPDIARTFGWASDAEERYIVLDGTFAFAAPERSRTNQFDQVTTPYAAEFEGRYLGVEGFVEGPRLDVTLHFICLGPWCGSMAQDQGRVLVFARQTEAGYTVDVDPCFSTIFPPDEETIQRVEACMRGEACEEVPF